MNQPAARARRGSALAVTALVLGALAAYLYAQRDHIAASYALDPGAMAAIAALAVAILALRGLQNRAVFRRLGIHAPLADWFGLVALSAFSNQLPLSAGLVAKALYLKRVYATSYGTFALGQLAVLLFVLATNGAVGLAVIAPGLASRGEALAAAGFALMLASGGLLWLPPSARLAARLRWLPDPAAAARALRPAWWRAGLTQLGIVVATAGTLHIAFGMGDAEVPFTACLVFSAAAVLSSVVSITPAALGIREFLVGAMAYLTGFEARDAVIASALARIPETLAVATLAALFSHRMSRRVMAGAPEPGAD